MPGKDEDQRLRVLNCRWVIQLDPYNTEALFLIAQMGVERNAWTCSREKHRIMQSSMLETRALKC